jgi:hypothetical protein
MKTITMRIIASVAAVGAALAAMLLVATGASAQSTAPAPGGVGGVHVTNPHPHAGGSITVSGTKCTPGATVTVKLDGSTTLGSGTTDSSGAYSIPVTIPSSTSPGHHTISVVGGNCAGSGVLGIEVLAPSGSGNLAGTGVAVVGIGAVGVVLLIGGGLMLLAGRRRAATHA